MEKEEVPTFEKYDYDSEKNVDIEGHLELNEEDDSPIEEVRVTVPSEYLVPCNGTSSCPCPCPGPGPGPVATTSF